MVRSFVLAFALAALVIPSASAEALGVIQNNSTFIDLAGGSTTYPTGGEGFSDGPGVGDGNGPTGDGGSSGSGSGEEGGGASGSSGIDSVIINYSPTDGSGSGDGDGSSPSTGGEEGASEEADAADLLGTLSGNQAISIKDAGGGAWSVSIDGDAVRRALAARGVRRISIPGFEEFGDFFSRAARALQTGQDFALVAASTALKNPGIDDITLAGGTLHISYRARGNLFAFIPIIYRIRIEVNP
ncbi:MAG: hypothetical protein AAB923_02555, partial [Patescibacteria group bacterium]